MLIIATEVGEDYLHSPVDDLESCFWVALWSVVFNEDHKHLFSRAEHMVRGCLAQTMKVDAAYDFGRLRFNDCSNIVQSFKPVVGAWWEMVRDIGPNWIREVLVRAPKDAGEEYYLPHFHLSALQGVVDVLQVMLEYWDGEIGWESWTAPTFQITSP